MTPRSPLRVSSSRLPPSPDRLAPTKRTRTDFVFLLFAGLCLAIAFFFAVQCTVLYIRKRALERQPNPPPVATSPAENTR
jgi:hypothetical protein